MVASAPVRAVAPVASPLPPVKPVAPVTLPPGRLRLATRPCWTGSPPVTKTMGIVVVAAFAASAAGAWSRRSLPRGGGPDRPRAPAVDHIDLRPAIFDRNVLALDVAGFLQTMAERG